MSRIKNGKVIIKTRYLYVLPNLLNVLVEYLLYVITNNSERTAIQSILNKLKPSDYKKQLMY